MNVAVGYPSVVGVIQCAGNFGDDPGHLADGPSRASDALLEVFSLDELAGHVFLPSWTHANIIQMRDSRVVQDGIQLCGPLEKLLMPLVSEDLQCNTT